MNLTEQKDLFKAQNKQNEITKAMMQNIVWQTKQRPHGNGKKKATYDIRVFDSPYSCHGKGAFMLSIIPERIEGLMHSGYVKIAILGDLLLLKAATEDDGWKVILPHTSAKASRVQVKVSGNAYLTEWANKNKGKYLIHYDVNSDFYFINAAEKDVY